MDKGLAFWVIFIIAFVFGLWSSWPVQRAHGISFVCFVLIFLLGWAEFGFVIR